MSQPLEFVMRDGDQIARLDASAWPRNARFSSYKIGIMEKAGIVDRDGAGVRFNVANGYAIYRVIHEYEHEISLELVEGNVIWSG